MDIFSPVVDHGKGELSSFFDKKFRDPQVQPGIHPGMGSAAGDNMHLGPGFGYDDIMNVLGHALGADVEAGLHRLGDAGPGQGPDKIAVVQFKFRGRGIFVSLHRNQLPIIFFQAIVLLQGFFDGKNFQTGLAGFTMHDRAVGLQKSAGMIFVRQFDAGPQEMFFFPGIKILIIFVIRPVLGLALKLLQVQILADGSLFIPAFFSCLF